MRIPVSENLVATSGRVVVGVDGSEGSKSALRWAAFIARVSGASIEAVAAWHYPVGVGWSAIPTNWNPETDAQSWLTDSIKDVFGDERPENLDTLVVEGNPAVVLLERAEGSVMVIVGSRGHGGFAGLMLGSVSSVVAEHARRPVLVVHGDHPPELSPGDRSH
jgi:nucleotide-binding universal stress UspA family protein